ncbi:MAG: polysaccharide deacetylase family protein [bacterium]|nr:polysaccharide deacetylase family protein [bacterium]
MSRFHHTLIAFAAAALAVLVAVPAPVRIWCLAGLGIGLVAAMAIGVALPGLQFYCMSICRGPVGGKRVALTFDDGPDPESTPVVLDALKEQNARATFFCVGERVKANPELARRMVDEGHLIGNHSYRHAWWTNFMMGSGLRREIEGARDAIEQAVGVRTRYYRSPMGLTNPHLAGALKASHHTHVAWDVRGLDRRPPTAHHVVTRVMDRVRDGSIVALHDGGVDAGGTAEIVRGVVAELRARDYRLVRLDELLEDGSVPGAVEEG